MLDPESRRSASGKVVLFLAGVLCFLTGMEGCARLPYTSKIIHQDRRVDVTLQREIHPAGYTHPVQLSPDEVAAILKGFSLRAQKGIPMRWFGEEEPPKPVFREDEIEVLMSWVAEGLRTAGPEERVHFALLAPGNNPASTHEVTSGWVAARDPFLYFTVEYFHTQVPIKKSDQYDISYPTSPPVPGSYHLYFEPGRFWVSNPEGTRGLEYREYLKSR